MLGYPAKRPSPRCASWRATSSWRGASGAAHVDDLEGLLYSYLREHENPGQALSFGALEGGGKLLVALEARNPVHCLRTAIFEALRRGAKVHPDARFAVGPIQLAKEGARAIEDAVAGLRRRDRYSRELAIIFRSRSPCAALARRRDDGPSEVRARAR